MDKAPRGVTVGAVNLLTNKRGAPGLLSRLHVQLRPKSRPHGLWVRAPHRAFCCHRGARLESSVSSLCPSSARALSQINNHLKNLIQKNKTNRREIHIREEVYDKKKRIAIKVYSERLTKLALTFLEVKA